MKQILSQTKTYFSALVGKTHQQKPIPASEQGFKRSKTVQLMTVVLSAWTAITPILPSVLYSQTSHAQSQIQTYAGGDPNYRPTLLRSDNDIPIVNIRSINEHGVSRNQFGQFDIDNKGVVLNNSFFNTNSLLAGKIDGNFWLANGSAKTIVNEIYHAHPTVLNGKIEVAGQPANIIIANPNGLNINGAEFINAHQQILTTGTVDYQQGQPTHIQVKQGTIQIDGKGLNTGQTQVSDKKRFAQLFSQMTNIQGQIIGQDDVVQVIAGNNKISLTPEMTAQDIQAQGIKNHPSSQTGQISVDIGQMGQVYANGIHIVSTADGVGVKQAGQLKAHQFLTLQADGKIVNTGETKANGLVEMIGGDIELGNSRIDAGAIHLQSTKGEVDWQNAQLNISKHEVLENNPELKAENGSLAVHSHQDMTVLADKTLKNVGDIRLSSDGKLILQGIGGEKGRGSEKNLSIQAGGSVQLAGKDVDVQGSDIQAQQGIAIYATEKDVKLSGISSDVEPFKDEGRIDELNTEMSRVDGHINTLQQDSIYQTALREKEKVEQQLHQLEKEYHKHTTPDDATTNKFYQDKQRLNTAIDGYKTQLEQRSKALNINKSIEQLTQEKLILDKSLKIAHTPFKGTEHRGATLTAKQDITLVAKNTVNIHQAKIETPEQVKIQALGTGEIRHVGKDEKGEVISKPISISIEGLSDVYQRGEEDEDAFSLHNNYHASQIQADKGISIQAMGDSNSNVLIVGGGLTAKNGNIDIQSLGSTVLQAGQDSVYDRETKVSTRKSWGGAKKKITTTTTTEQIKDADVVKLTADNIQLQTGENIHAYGTEFNAQNRIFVQAGRRIGLMSVNSLNLTNVDSKTVSRFAGVRYKTSKSNDYRQMVEDLPTSLVANITDVQSGSNIHLQGTQFHTLQKANIVAGVGDKAVPDAKIIFDKISKTVEEGHHKESNYQVWQKMSGYGFTREQAELPRFTGNGKVDFRATGGLQIDVPINKNDPDHKEHLINVLKANSTRDGYAYLNDIIVRSDVDFKAVELVFDEWDYKQQGLTPAGALIIAIAVTIATGGSGAGVGASLTGTSGALGAMANAGFSSLVSQASISLINNGFDLKDTAKDLGSKDNVRQLVTGVVTAGLIDKIGGTAWVQQFNGNELHQRIVKNVIDNTSRAVVESTINGGKLSDNLKTAIVSGVLTGVHGELAQQIKGLENNYILHKLAHAAGGCAVGALQKQCEAGAIGAVVGEVVAGMMPPANKVFYTDKEIAKVQAIGQLASAVVSTYAGYEPQYAVNSAQTAIQNNGVRDWLARQTDILSDQVSTTSKEYLNKWESLVRKGDIKALQQLKSEIDTYLNSQYEKRQLTTFEMHAFGTVSGLTEAMFPQNILDFGFGIGKGVNKGTDVAKIMANASDKAKAEYKYVYTSLNANTPALKGTPYHPSIVEARLLTPAQKEAWIKQLPLVIEKQPIRINGKVVKMDVDLEPTIRRILDNKPNVALKDGKVYNNFQPPLLPAHTFYTEWTVPTPGVNGRGTQRIVVGADGSMWYTPNHYGDERINPKVPPSKTNKPLGNTWRRIK